MSFYQYSPDGTSFISRQAVGIKTIYAPLCGVDASSIKSAITPHLSGDIKIDKAHYITKPASREDLRLSLREFFVFIKPGEVYKLSDASPDNAAIEVGALWHKLQKTEDKAGLTLSAVNFVPVSGQDVEIMLLSVKNISKKTIKFTPTAAIPLFGRSLANKHDHEHVTALLNRAAQVPEGVVMHSTMAFNEEGHKAGRGVYFVYGSDSGSGRIAGSFPTVDSFYGDGGSLEMPLAVLENHKPAMLGPKVIHGKEVVGALRFKDVTLKAGKEQGFIIVIGTAADEESSRKIFNQFNSSQKVVRALETNKKFWADKSSSVIFNTAEQEFNSWMRWVTLQPVLRRIFGCSFLPDHDYGKGGRGWRDIWQDLLSLILIEPQQVRQDLINNCAGVRIDGSNATIIGSQPGEFIADRNAITRVWMDHGAWPFLTLGLYIDQSGDFDILLQKQSYFRDPQLSRTRDKDLGWVGQYGHQLLDKNGEVYKGTIIEHVLLQQLTQFFNVGEHNIIRLESADWNDGLDMAFSKGESVAFSFFYAGNLLKIADLLEDLGASKGTKNIQVFQELLTLIDFGKVNYNDAQAKHDHLFGKYFHSVQPAISGQTAQISIKDLARDLRGKGHWMFTHLRRQEKIQLKEDGRNYEWFNGYYDNKGKRVEGLVDKKVRMTLTAQVFAVMSGMASEKEIENVVASVDHFLKDKELGGYRLNTDFGLPHYLDLGRAFGFAFGTKENGAFFSHMNVMYANSLYQRGFARQGFEVLQSIYRMASDGERSKIYPGIPEYFDAQGRGMYHYLTGSASWLVLTELLYVFGVRGVRGDLLLAPQLVKEEFNKKGLAGVACQFAGKRLNIEYHNPKKLDAGQYVIKEVSIDAKPFPVPSDSKSQVRIPRASITRDSLIKVTLGPQ